MTPKLELLSPAGTLEKLRMAVLYGADAVYLAGSRFGLRSGAGNFTPDEMREGVAFAHAHGAKAYLAMNILPRTHEMDDAAAFVFESLATGVDAVIVSDPGMLDIVRQVSDAIPIHLSTQANTTNAAAARFWHRQGVSRIILARELPLAEIARLRAETPPELELEAFVHGAMCMAISGRCHLSSHLTGRDANRGDCAQPCRWKFALVEEKRPGEYMPVESDDRGSWLLNSRDLCMIGRLREVAAAGITSFKIEGRMKSAFYVATVTHAYRRELDALLGGESIDFEPLMSEVSMVSNRTFTNGFYDGDPGEDGQMSHRGGYLQNADFIGLFLGMSEDGRFARFEQRNHFRRGERVEIMSPRTDTVPFTIGEMRDADGMEIEAAPHPQMEVWIRVDAPVPANAILRRPRR